MRRQLKVADTFLFWSIEILIPGNADFCGSINKAIADLTVNAHVGNTQRTTYAVVVVVASLLVLCPPKVG